MDGANAIARCRLKEKAIRVGQQVCEIDGNREITKTISRLRTGHLSGIKINPNNTKTHVKCRICSDKEHSQRHIFSYPAKLTIHTHEHTH